MSIIQNIRERGTWIIFGIIAIALIAFILQDGIGRKNGGADTTTLGKINGELINRLDFEKKLDIQVQNYASQGIKREQIIGFLWNQEVDRLLFKNEEDKLGITVGTKELNDVLFGSESPFKQEFTDKTTGEFKVNDARNSIAQIKKSKNKEQINQIESFYIEPAIENRLRGKYQALIVRGVQLPKWLADKELVESNSISSFSFVTVPYTSIPDSSLKVSNDDINAYLKEHAAAYQNEEASRSINFVGFSAAPSSQDTSEVFNQVNALKEQFKNSTDVVGFLNKTGSDIPFYNSFISKNIIQIPQKDSIFALPVGGVFGPYVDVKNITIAKVLAVTQWPDSASVRHILIATTNPQNGQQIRPDSVAKTLADSISLAINGGASFEVMCEKYSEDQGSKAVGGKYDMFPQAKMIQPFNDFAFDKPVGSKGVVKTDFGYHIMEVLKQTSKGPAYKIAYLSKPLSPSSETINAASTAAAQFAVSSKDQKSFIANAVKLNKQLLPATGIKENDYTIQGIGDARATVRWIFEKKINEVSEPFEVGDIYYVAVVSGIDNQGLLSAEAARPQVEGIIRDQVKATKIKASFKGSSLASYAASGKTIVMTADSVAFAYSLVPNVGNEPKIIGAAFNKNLINKVSEPIAGSTGVFALSVRSLGAKPSQQDPLLFREESLQRTRSLFYRSSVALKKVATIKDNRAKIY